MHSAIVIDGERCNLRPCPAGRRETHHIIHLLPIAYRQSLTFGPGTGCPPAAKLFATSAPDMRRYGDKSQDAEFVPLRRKQSNLAPWRDSRERRRANLDLRPGPGPRRNQRVTPKGADRAEGRGPCACHSCKLYGNGSMYATQHAQAIPG